jgi:hypothetical protein
MALACKILIQARRRKDQMLGIRNLAGRAAATAAKGNEGNRQKTCEPQVQRNLQKNALGVPARNLLLAGAVFSFTRTGLPPWVCPLASTFSSIARKSS